MVVDSNILFRDNFLLPRPRSATRLSCFTILILIVLLLLRVLKADFHSMQFSERAEFRDRFLLKCVQSAMSNEIHST